MNFENILCPVDFTEASTMAIEKASSLAKRYDAKLHFVYSYEPVFADGHVDGMPMPPQPPDVEPLRERLEKVTPTVEDVQHCHAMTFGFPANAILTYAEENKIDLIVMGTHGRHGLGRVLMGSVAEAVVRSATCPVLTVHSKAPVN